MTDAEKRQRAGEMIDDIQFLRDALIARQDNLVSPLNIPAQQTDARILKVLLKINDYSPKTTLEFLRDLEKTLRPVKSFQDDLTAHPSGVEYLAGITEKGKKAPPPLPE